MNKQTKKCTVELIQPKKDGGEAIGKKVEPRKKVDRKTTIKNFDRATLTFGDDLFFDYILHNCFEKNINIKINDIVVDSDAANEKSKKYVGMRETFIDLIYDISPSYNKNADFMDESESKFFIQDFLKIQTIADKGARGSTAQKDQDLKIERLLQEISSIRRGTQWNMFDLGRRGQIKNQLADIEYKLSQLYLKNKNICFLLGKAGAGKSTLTQYIALANWAKWLKLERPSYMFNEGFFSFIKDVEKKYPDFFNKETKSIAFKIRLAEYDKYLSLLSNSDFDSYSGILHFLSYIIYLEIDETIKEKEINFETINKFLKESKNEHSFANSIYSYINIKNKEADLQKIFLFDGLDEVRSARKEVITHLVDFLKINFQSNNIALVSSRAENAQDILLEKITRKQSFDGGQDDIESSENLFDIIFNLRDINEEDELVETYIDRFCSAKYTGDSIEPISLAIKKAYRTMLHIHTLLTTPLEVVMVCLIYHDGNLVPDNKLDLYKKYVNMLYLRERSKSVDEFYQNLFDGCQTEILKIIEWVSYGFEFKSNFTANKDEIRKYITQKFKFKVYSNEVINGICEIILERFKVLVPDSKFAKEYTKGDLHNTVYEYLTAMYISRLRYGEVEKELLNLIILGRYQIFDFVIGLLHIASEKDEDNHKFEQFLFRIHAYDDDIVKATALTSLAATEISALDIYSKLPSEFRNPIILSLKKYFLLDNQNDRQLELIQAIIENDPYGQVYSLLDEILKERYFSKNLFSILLYIREKHAKDVEDYYYIKSEIQSDRFNKNIFKFAKKYGVKISRDLIIKILADKNKINMSENDIELLCDTILEIELIDALKGYFNSYNSIVEREVRWGKPIDDKFDPYNIVDVNWYFEQPLFHECQQQSVFKEDSFFNISYVLLSDENDRQGIERFAEKLEAINLKACSHMMRCVGNPSRENLSTFAEKLEEDAYYLEICQIFDNRLDGLKYNIRIPVVALLRRSRKIEVRKKATSIISKSFDDGNFKLFDAQYKSIADIIPLWELTSPCGFIGVNISNIEDWLKKFSKAAITLKNSNGCYSLGATTLLSFLMSNYIWSCQHGYYISFDNNYERFYEKMGNLVSDLLFTQYKLEDSYKIDLLELFLARPSKMISSEVKLLKELEINYNLDTLLDDALSQVQIDEEETFFRSERYRSIIDNLADLISSGAEQYKPLFLIKFLGLRTTDKENINYIRAFNLPRQINKENESEVNYIYDIIIILKQWSTQTQNDEREIALQLIEVIENFKEGKDKWLKLVIYFVDFNFESKKYCGLFYAILNRIVNDGSFYESRQLMQELLYKDVKNLSCIPWANVN